MEQNLENVRSIYPLNMSKTFSHEEAMELVSLLIHITAKTKRELSILNSQLSFFKSQSEKAQHIQEKINYILQNWSEKVRRLGGIPVSFGKVRIPGEDGHYLWEHPDNRLFMH